ncbi:MAG: DoxX family protein [Candidatus Micrarchaeia archaeon]
MGKFMKNADLADWGMLALRAAVVLFFFHGLSKLTNLDGTSTFFASLGIPFPWIMALFIALLETLGPIAILFGIGTRYFAALLAMDMLVAILLARLGMVLKAGLPMGITKAELEFTYMLATAAIALIGPGKYSLEAWLAKKK